MNIKQKYKELNIKSGKVLSRYAWLLPIIETLGYLPVLMLYIINENALVAGNFNVYISSLSFFLFRYGVTRNVFFFVVVGFLPFVLRVVSALFVLKKKRWACFLTMVLYFVDFITSLIMLCTDITPLQELNDFCLFCLFITIWLAPSVSGVYFYIYIDNFNLEYQKTPRAVNMYFTVVISVLVIVFSLVWVNGNKKIATESEVATLNRCYEYSEKYLYEKLPEDKETLEKMQNDIEEVFNKELFFTAFNQSEYFERMKEEQVSKTDIPVTMKSEYANELMYLKSKILLKLDKNEEYVDYYIETRQYFSHVKVYIFSEHLANDKANFNDEDYDTIKKGCFAFFESDGLEYEKLLCLTDLGFVNSQFMTDDERVKLGKEIREKYMPGYTKEMFKADLAEWETLERALYMLK